MKIIPCPACGRRVKPQKYCPSCGCYLPPLLEEEINYNIDYIWYNKHSKFIDIDCNTYFNNIPSNINSQTQANLAQLDSCLDAQLQLQIQRLESNLRAYKTQLNNNAQSQFILNQMSQMYLEPYRDEKGRLQNCKWTHTE